MSREVDRTTRIGAQRPKLPATSGLRSYLVVREGPERGALLAATGQRALVGRAPEAALRLTDAAVSSRHLEVWYLDGALWAEDLGSANGTTLDEEPIEIPTAVPVGAHLVLGKTVLRHELRAPDEVARERELVDDLSRASGYVEAILPPPISEGPVRVEWRFIPAADLGGDAFGYRWLDDDRFALYLLDVSGHGAQAALHSISALNLLRHGHLRDADPADPAAVLAAFNDSFQMSEHGGLFFTAWYGVYDRRDGRLRFASAGHPAPLLLRAEGGLDRLELRNPPIGMMPGLAYRDAERRLAAGDRLYLFSDGVFELETEDEGDWGYTNLAEVVGRPSVPGLSECQRIEIDVRSALAGRAFEDDYSLVVFTVAE